jgi:hypothetical protein
MNRTLKTLSWATLVLLGLGVALVAGIAATVGAFDLEPLIEINGEAITLADASVGHWLAGSIGVVVGLLVVLLVVPVAVFLPMLIVAVVLAGVLGGALLFVLGALALVLSPLLLLLAAVWLVVRVARGQPRKAGATIST